MIYPLEASNAVVAQFLWNRRGAICTMCTNLMPEGYCVDARCATYSISFGEGFIARFKEVIASTHSNFKKRATLKAKHSKVVSGGRVESKRRKH
jgi:hypothetical protein